MLAEQSTPGRPEAGRPTPDAADVLRPTVALLQVLDRAPLKVGKYLQALLIVAGGAVVAELLYRAFNTTQLAGVFLTAVLIVAVRLGAKAAMLAAVVAFLFYNVYLMEPRFTLQLASADDFITLSVFLVAALLTGGLAGRARDERETARARARKLAILFDAGRVMSATEEVAILRERLAVMIGQACQTEARLRFVDGAENAFAFAEIPAFADEEIARVVALMEERGAAFATVRYGVWRARRLQVDEQVLGLAVWRVPAVPHADTAELDNVVGILLDMGAAAIVRAALGEDRAAVEAIRRTEALRTALLSSMSHDFRTPLSAILASATSLLEYDRQFEPEVREDLLRNIQEEAERLNRFVANLLNMTRLESGALEVQASVFPVEEAVAGMARRLERRDRSGRIRTPRNPAQPQACADPLLLEQSLVNVVENALSFSPESGAVTVVVDQVGDRVVIEVVDEGQGVAPADLGRIFDKFYRASDARASAQGTGLGLSIARGLVEAMGGAVEARARPDGASGLSVLITLPAADR